MDSRQGIHPSDLASLQDSVTFVLNGVYKLAIISVDRIFEVYGVDRRHVAVLAVLNTQFLQDGTGLPQVELMKITGLDRTSMVDLVDRLEGLGWAKRTPHPTDRRVNMVVMLPEGAEFLIDIQAKITQAERDFLANLQPQEQLELLRLLRKVIG